MYSWRQVPRTEERVVYQTTSRLSQEEEVSGRAWFPVASSVVARCVEPLQCFVFSCPRWLAQCINSTKNRAWANPIVPSSDIILCLRIACGPLCFARAAVAAAPSVRAGGAVAGLRPGLSGQAPGMSKDRKARFAEGSGPSLLSFAFQKP